MKAHKYSILYVDSDHTAFSAVARLLTKNGFILNVAENGREGVRLFAEVHPHIVITELDLPHMDGLEMIRQLRCCNPMLQIVALSSQPAPEQLIEAINLGVHFFLRKPVNEIQLRSILNRALHNMRYGPVMTAEAGEEAEARRTEESRGVRALSDQDGLPADNTAEIHRINAELEYRLLRRNSLLEAANKELEDFCDAISHDLRGPLTRLQGFSHVLCEDYGEQLDAQGKLYLERIERTSRQLKTILDALLDLSMLSRKSLSSQVVDLSTIANNVVSQLRDGSPQRAVACIIAPALTANGDPGLLRIALENLLGNAWKFTSRSKSARVEFGVASNGGKTVFFVRDNGVGFDMRYAGKLFKPFHRIHNHEEFPGTGVGLAAVQRIVKRHGGRIWAEAEEGKGATFYFTL